MQDASPQCVHAKITKTILPQFPLADARIKLTMYL